MSLVSPTLPSPGDVANASDISTPINQLATVINGGLDDTNINTISGSKIAAGTVDSAQLKDAGVTGSKIAAGTVDTAQLKDQSVTNAKLATGTGEAGGAWSAWTPTWTNLTLGNGVATARYTRIGMTVNFRLSLTVGSTTSMTASQVMASLPIAAHAQYQNFEHIAYGTAFDVSANQPYNIRATFSNSTTIKLYALNAASTFVPDSNVNNTQPFTWATGDILQVVGTYEAA